MIRIIKHRPSNYSLTCESRNLQHYGQLFWWRFFLTAMRKANFKSWQLFIKEAAWNISPVLPQNILNLKSHNIKMIGQLAAHLWEADVHSKVPGFPHRVLVCGW
jgi:hypothetical protein